MANMKLLSFVLAFTVLFLLNVLNALRLSDEQDVDHLEDDEADDEDKDLSQDERRLLKNGSETAPSTAVAAKTPRPTPMPTPEAIVLTEKFNGSSTCTSHKFPLGGGKEKKYLNISNKQNCTKIGSAIGVLTFEYVLPTPKPPGPFLQNLCVARGDQIEEDQNVYGDHNIEQVVWIPNITQEDLARMGNLHELCRRECFPSSAKVYSKGRGLVRIDTLRQGDLILSVDGTGHVFYDEASFYSLADSESKGETFFAITTVANRVIRLTASHHLPTGSACCTNLTKAMDLRIGDAVWIVGDSDQVAIPDNVKSIETVVDDGLHSPVMLHGGHPIIDGVVTSFDDLHSIGMSARWMPSLSSICMAGNMCGLMAKGVKMFECITKGECDERKVIQATTVSTIL